LVKATGRDLAWPLNSSDVPFIDVMREYIDMSVMMLQRQKNSACE